MSAETQRRRGPSVLGKGAALAAPTAPHATPPSAGPTARNGPARFWDAAWLRRAFTVTLIASAVVHAVLSPWSLFPKQSLELREVEGELSIAIETVEEAPPPPPPEPPKVEPPPAAPATPEGPGARDAGRRPRDASADAARDAAADAARDAKAPRDASGEAGEDADAGGLALGPTDGGREGEGGAVAATDAGALPPGANGPRDPEAVIGAAGAVQADVPLVQLLVNVAEIRKQPVGAKMGPLLSAIPEWDEYIAGTNVDPLRDTDWIYMSGPSLISKRTARLAIIIRYAAPDAVVDKAIETLARKHPSGGPFDAGVPGVKGYLGHADFAPRVFLRPQSHVLAIVPPDYATKAAKQLARAKVAPKVQAGEAMRMTLKNPSRPMPFLSPTLKEMRLWIRPRADGGADVHGELDAADAEDAEKSAKTITKLIRDQNSVMVQMVTRGVLNRAEVKADGSMVRVHVPASEEHVQALLDFVLAYFGVGKPK